MGANAELAVDFAAVGFESDFVDVVLGVGPAVGLAVLAVVLVLAVALVVLAVVLVVLTVGLVVMTVGLVVMAVGLVAAHAVGVDADSIAVVELDADSVAAAVLPDAVGVDADV